MSNYNFTYRSDGFTLENAPHAGLFIKAGKTEISLLVASDGKLLAWKDKCPADEFKVNAELQQLLAAPFKQVVIGVAPDNLTLVPADLFLPEHLTDYARLLDVKPEDKVFAARLDNDNQLIYRADKGVPDMLAKSFDLGNMVPADRGWIAAIAKSLPGNNDLFLNSIDNQLSIVNFNGGKLRFYNIFKTEDINDAIYYSLFIVKRLEIQPDDAGIIISGNYADSDIEKFREFFKTVRYSELKVLDMPPGVPAHQLLSLASLA